MDIDFSTNIPAMLTAAATLATALAQAYVIVQNSRLRMKVQNSIDLSAANSRAIKVNAEAITTKVEGVKDEIAKVVVEQVKATTAMNGHSDTARQAADDAGFNRGMVAGAQAERDNPTKP